MKLLATLRALRSAFVAERPRPFDRGDRAVARAAAHIGSPDVFLDGTAGPYRVLVTVRPPYAVPGVADVEILTTSSDVKEVRIVPLPLSGPGAQFAPGARRRGALGRRSAPLRRPSLDDDRGRVAGPGRHRRRPRRGHALGAGPDAAAGDARHDARGSRPALRVDAPALRRLHRHHLGHGARGEARRRRNARRRRAPPRPHRGGRRRCASPSPPCSSATGGGRRKRRATRGTSTSRCRRRRR